MKEEIKKLREALQYYADRQHILSSGEEQEGQSYIMKYEDSHGSEHLTSIENGNKARVALGLV